jgi:DNA-directed RNA polymerase specialized sigma24 family protein
LPEPDRHSGSARAWLIRVTRDYSPEHLLRHHRLTQGAVAGQEHESRGESPLPELEGLGDGEILFLAELLPLAERQVVLLRYGLRLDAEQIAQILGRPHGAVTRLEQRALASIRTRRRAIGARDRGRQEGPRRQGAFRRAWNARARSLVQPETKTARATPAAAASFNEASLA